MAAATDGAPPGTSPNPGAVALLWLEQPFRQPLRAADGSEVSVLQPGLPESPGALRFIDAALRLGGGETVTGVVQVGEGSSLLRVVWEADGEGDGPVLALRDQLLAPWPEVAGLFDAFAGAPPASRAPEPPVRADAEAILSLLRAAGEYRIARRGRRLGLRLQAVGRAQLLWEASAEALGYHANREPFRHLARRLPLSFLGPLDPEERTALLFGAAGFLPSGDAAGLSPEASSRLRSLWDRWWKARSAFGYAVLPAGVWDRKGVRPVNRPERRLAALAVLAPQVPRIERALDRRDPEAFARVFAECHDPFWSRHLSWKGKASPKPLQLVGEDRIADLALNLFWPLVHRDDPAAALAALEETPSTANRAVREARERLFGGAISARSLRSALLQQGLLQIHRDFCRTPRPPGALQSLLDRWQGSS